MVAKAVYDTEDALQRLIESLDARKNQLFDPTLLAMAEGFLAPTKTGGFGESLGAAAGKARVAQEEESKRAMEDAKARMEIAQLQAQMKGQTEGWQALMGAPSGAAPTGAAATGAAPAGGAPSTIPLGLSREQYLNMARAAGQSPMDAMLGYDKYLREGTKQTEAGSWDLRTNTFTPTPSAELVPLTIYDPVLAPPRDEDGRKVFQTANVPKNIAIRANQLLEQGGKQEEYRKLLAPFITGFGAAPTAPSAVPSGAPEASGTPAGAAVGAAAPSAAAGAAPVAPSAMAPRVETIEEKEARKRKEETEQAAEKETQMLIAKQKGQETADIFAQGNSAMNALPLIERQRKILANNPGIEKYLGILERPDVRAQLGTLAENTLKVGSFSIGIPEVRKVLTNAGAPQSIIDALSEMTQLNVMHQLEERKGLGSGTSVSNYEQQLQNQTSASTADNINAYLRKLDVIENRFKFRQELANAIRAKNTTFDKFQRTDDFKKMFDDYKEKQSTLLEGMKPAAAPKEGDTSTSKSGRRMIYKNGNWEYVK